MNSASRRAGFALALCVLVGAALCGCGVNVHSPSVRGIGYVRLDEVVKHHPLYPQLAQLDDAIAAIDLAAAGPHVPLSGPQMRKQIAVLNAELRDAQDRANKILAAKQQDYERREAQAVAAALAAARVPGAGAYAARAMSATSAQQAQQAEQAANQDFMAYQQSVIAQSNAATSAVARELNAAAAAKYRAKAEQLQQDETNLSLQLTQKDAPTTLAIKTRLNNLALDEATRKSLEGQLATINANEAAAMQAQRRSDQAALAAYQAQLSKETSQAIASQAGQIGSETRAKIEERGNEVGQQIRSLGPPPLPANLPAGTREKIAQIHETFAAQFRADAQKTYNDYNATKADLDRQFAAMHGADVGATGAAAKELAQLQARRTDLYNQIVGQITSESDRLAKNLGLTTVFVNITAAAGGYDLTNDLIKDVESLKE